RQGGAGAVADVRQAHAAGDLAGAADAEDAARLRRLLLPRAVERPVGAKAEGVIAAGGPWRQRVVPFRGHWGQVDAPAGAVARAVKQRDLNADGLVVGLGKPRLVERV